MRYLLALAFMLALSGAARAQFTVPTVAPPTGAQLFAQHCGTCHTINPADGPRAGPLLAHVIGRKAGSLPGFAYSPGFAHADITWDAASLDRWLNDPQAVIPGAVMLYKQADPEVRHSIIAYLQEQG
jgi:cytochrome c